MAEKRLLEDWSYSQTLTLGDPFDLNPDFITVDPHFQAFHSSMNMLEEKQLEENLLKLGCINPLIVWKKNMKEWLLIDGHYRFRLCKKNHIPFKVRDIDFQDDDQAKAFMLEEQLGRRNLTTEQLQYYRGLKYESLVKQHTSGKMRSLTDDSNIKRTCELLAKKYNVSRNTIIRDAEYAKGMELLGRANPSLKVEVLSGAAKIAKKDVQELARLKTIKTLGKVKTIKDVTRKLKSIRKYKEAQINEYSLRRKFAREEEFRAIQASMSEVFPDTDSHLNSLKGKVLSSMREGINNRDTSSIRLAMQYLQEIEKIIKISKADKALKKA